MKYVECPDPYKPGNEHAIFLAGGITGCPDWQADMCKLLADTDFVVFNPRRAEFNISDPVFTDEQITWEHQRLRMADEISFWFPKDTLCPITLYELGTWTDNRYNTPIVIGIEPGYARENDIRVQTKLLDPFIPIVSSLEDLAGILIDGI